MTVLSNSVQTRISRAAQRLAYASVTEDDFSQQAALKIIEAETTRPELSRQTDAYIAQLGIWEARNLVKSEDKISQRTFPIDETSDEDGYRFTEIEADQLGPEEQAIQDDVIRAITKALEGLKPDTTTIVKMLYLGYGEAEIARTLNISKSSVSQKKAKLRNILKRIL
jgi:RNA polymerase sigma factor (sigma-70 family)